jgi:hypothetical protein
MALLSIVTAIWLGAWNYWAIRKLIRGRRSPILFAFPIHFIYCGLPLFLDVFVGIPLYVIFPGFATAANDPTTRFLYCLYVAACPILWYSGVGASQSTMLGQVSSLNSAGRSHPLVPLLLGGVILLPLAMVLASPDPQMYLMYTPNQRDLYNRGSEAFYHALVVKAIQLSSLAAALVVARSRRPWLATAVLMPCFIMNAWLHGKRNIVALILVFLIYALWRRGRLTGHRLWVAGFVSAAIFFSFSFVYQSELRNETSGSHRDFTQQLENARVDFGRDHVIKLAIYSELARSSQPLIDYRGQILVYAATMPIPSSVFPNKPTNYAEYVMTEAMGRPSPGGGTMTTTCLAEAISNFSWFGLLLGPIFPLLVSRLGETTRREFVYLMSVFIVCCSLVVSFSFWAHVAYLWVAAVAWIWFAGSKRKGAEARLPAPRSARSRAAAQPEV